MGTLIGPVGGPEVAALLAGAKVRSPQARAALMSEAFFAEDAVAWGRGALSATLMLLDELEAAQFEDSLREIYDVAASALGSDLPAFRIGVFDGDKSAYLIVIGGGKLALRIERPDLFVISVGDGPSELEDAVGSIDESSTFTVERIDAHGDRALCFAAGAVSVMTEEGWRELGELAPAALAAELIDWPWN